MECVHEVIHVEAASGAEKADDAGVGRHLHVDQTALLEQAPCDISRGATRASVDDDAQRIEGDDVGSGMDRWIGIHEATALVEQRSRALEIRDARADSFESVEL